MKEVRSLNFNYEIPDQIKFESTADGLVLITIENQFSKASFSLQGGHLLSWQPKGQADVIWMSDEAVFAEACSIRGGTPICWPWFGAHPTENNFPAHGFARTNNWEVIETKSLSNGETYLLIRLLQEDINVEHKVKGAVLELEIRVGEQLNMAMLTANTSEQTITIGGAFHTYFRISDIENVIIQGFEGNTFIDTLDNWVEKTEADPIRINAEIDRIYFDSPDKDCLIVDTGLKRKIRISKQGSHSSVVWNPWIDKSIALGDMGVNGYRKMLCVESTNAATDIIEIVPGGEHRMSVCYQLESL